MNLLAFLALIGCLTTFAVAAMFPDEIKDVLKAIAERIRSPRLTPLEEYHRHIEAMSTEEGEEL